MHVNSLFCVLFCLLSYVSTSKILILNPMFGFSHVKFVSKLADVIADNGHNVTLFQPFHIALKNTEGLVKNKNIEIINYYPDHFEELTKAETQTFPMFWDSKAANNPILGAFVLPKMLTDEFKKTAIQVLKDKKLRNELKSKNFDVVMTETFDISGFYLGHLLDLPCIPFMSAVRFPVFNEMFGQPSTLGYVPMIDSELAPSAGFFDRLNDVYRTFFQNYMMEKMAGYQNVYIEEALGHPVPYWKDLVAKSPIYITNSNPYLDFAVPTPGTIVHVGGMTMDLEKMKKVAALPEEYETILKERDSTVLISFGSVIRSFEMPESFRAGLITMFMNLPDVTFIWKYERDDVEFQKRLPSNVHLKKWVPQPALLADKRVKVFVTHGGLGSTMEVAYTGKPAIMVPIFGDQPNNAAMLARHGGAVAYDKFDLQDGEKLTETIKDLISNPKYAENADVLLRVLQNQPIDPKMNLIKHLEFAIKFPNFRSQVPTIGKVGTVAHYYLDVVAFLAIVSLVLAFVLVKILKSIRIRFMTKKSKNE